MTTQPIRPSWIDAPDSEWPSEIRAAYSLMAKAARRRLEAEGAAMERKPPEVIPMVAHPQNHSHSVGSKKKNTITRRKIA